MSDDDRIAELFRAAASDTGAPPPAFDHGDVVAASRQITTRRRSALVGGLSVLALVGIGVAVVQAPRSQDSTVTAAAPAMVDSAGGAAQAERVQSAPNADVTVPDALTGVPPFTGTPLGKGSGECADRQDPALRAYVEQVLPEVVGASTSALTGQVCLPGGERYLGLEVTDGAAVGTLTVAYLPPGTVASLVPGAISAPTASGGTVIVGSGPAVAQGPVPFEGRLDTLLAFLAERL